MPQLKLHRFRVQPQDYRTVYKSNQGPHLCGQSRKGPDVRLRKTGANCRAKWAGSPTGPGFRLVGPGTTLERMTSLDGSRPGPSWPLFPIQLRFFLGVLQTVQQKSLQMSSHHSLITLIR
ncbi:hypothetical protein PspLS_04248 [Pyricularia sp. CBS 133598]|nr:hypothetical protein PspLS_04248 [Pyricularia sp. CBS 133598]